MDPSVPIYYSNRALCYLKLQQWTSAISDCRKALEIDNNLVKAHFFLGQALTETGNYNEALKYLQRAHELAREKKINFGDDIAYQIRLVKRLKWNKIEDEAVELEEELRNYLVDLIKKDRHEKLKDLNDQLTKLGTDPASSSSSWQPTASSSQSIDLTTPERKAERLEAQETTIKSKCDTYTSKLENIFDNLRQHRRKRSVPDYLCGKISFEIMHEPVITPSGITYDRQDIEQHLKRVGHFDPITRQPLRAHQLVPNLAMKEVVDAYVNDNEWSLYN